MKLRTGSHVIMYARPLVTMDHVEAHVARANVHSIRKDQPMHEVKIDKDFVIPAGTVFRIREEDLERRTY